jgi:NADH:ubiquinone oxidoreductase subunit H
MIGVAAMFAKTFFFIFFFMWVRWTFRASASTS